MKRPSSRWHRRRRSSLPTIAARQERPKVVFALSGKEGTCEPGHTLLQAARASGVRIGAACESGLCGNLQR